MRVFEENRYRSERKRRGDEGDDRSMGRERGEKVESEENRRRNEKVWVE
jgi:hypothetical protein